MGLSAHKAYNSAWFCTSSKNPLRPLMFRDPESVSAKCEFPAHPIENRCNCRSEFATAWKLEEIEICNSGVA